MDLYSLTVLLVFLACAAVLASIVYWAIKLGITPTATGNTVRKTLETLLPPGIKADIIDLGSAWGSLLPVLKPHYPEEDILGIERSPVPWVISYCRFYQDRKVSTVHGNFFDLDLSGAGLVVCYLQKDIMTALSEHLQEQLPAGCYILSHTFHLPGWTPLKTIHAPDLYKTPVYLYRKS